MAFLIADTYLCWAVIVLSAVSVALFAGNCLISSIQVDNLPAVNEAQKFMPRLFSNTQFACSAVSLLQKGYRKFHTRPFQLTRNDGRIIVLPSDHLHELAALPSTIVSPQAALERDLLGQHTGINIILQSRLHHSIIQRKLTSRLKLLSGDLEGELNDIVSTEFPQSDEWTEIQPYQILAKVSARVTARALVGETLCRDPVWNDISINYTESLFRTIVLLRVFPRWTAYIFRYFIPSWWQGHRHLQTAKKLLCPRISAQLGKSDAGQLSDEASSEINVMSWLADVAKGTDRDPVILAHLQVLLALASVHTVLLRMVNVLYDLTANPSYIPTLIDEIESQRDQWGHGSYDALQKLDSVLRESQRMSPPTVLGMKRLFKSSFTFSSGLHVPQGSYVCMPIMAIENDSSICPDPEKFDGFRSFRQRQAAGEQDNHQFSSPEPTVLSFGFGKTACPGRFFASVVLKMVFVKLLTTYEFKFKDGKGRPRNLTAHEFLFPWPWDTMLIRRRSKSTCPF